jgi:hypothetical protein
MKKQKTDELQAEYDFKGGERGKFYRPDATLCIVRLEPEVVAFYQARAQHEQRDYVELINQDLRQAMNESAKTARSRKVRHAVAEAVPKYLPKPKSKKAAARKSV